MGEPKKEPADSKSVGDTTHSRPFDDPLQDPKYRVPHRDAPVEGDLKAALALLQSFERRLLHTAEAGAQWVRPHTKEDVDREIKARQKLFDESKDGPHKALHGNILCMAYLEKGLDAAKRHIQLRLNKVEAHPLELESLKNEVHESLMAGMDLRQYLRRKDGHPDRDDVLGEMIGEPYKIFMSTLPDAHRVLVVTFDLRRRKEASAMQCIDKVLDAAVQLSKAYPEYVRAAIDKKFENLRNWSKKRVYAQVDDEDFDKIHQQTLVARNMLLDFELPKREAANPDEVKDGPQRSWAGRASLNSLALLREATDIVCDIAHVRGERKKSADFFVARVQEELSRNAGMSGPGGGGSARMT